jgi:hypothetical protein
MIALAKVEQESIAENRLRRVGDDERDRTVYLSRDRYEYTADEAIKAIKLTGDRKMTRRAAMYVDTRLSGPLEQKTIKNYCELTGRSRTRCL